MKDTTKIEKAINAATGANDWTYRYETPSDYVFSNSYAKDARTEISVHKDNIYKVELDLDFYENTPIPFDTLKYVESLQK